MADDAQTGGAPADPGGIPLPQYVAIQVALAEGFPLREVLAVEQVEREAWSSADPEWKERLADGAAQKNGLFARYAEERASAEDWLFRRVAPLDSDAAAWVAFQGALADPATASGVLKVTRLRMNDVGRLTRLWERKVAMDPGLAGRLRELGKSGPGKLPEVVAAPPALRRWRGAQGAPPRAVEAGKGIEGGPARGGGEAGRAEAASAGADTALPGTPVLAQPSFMAGPPAGAAAQPSFMAAARVPSFMASGAAGPSSLAPAAAAPSFAQPPAPAAPALSLAAQAGETADASAILAGEVLPFSDKAAPAPQAGETVDVGALLAGEVLPFSDKPAQGGSAFSDRPAQEGLPFSDRPAQEGLPFSDRPGQKGTATSTEAARPQEPPPARADAGETADAGALLAGEALPFSNRQDAGETADAEALLAGEALPFSNAGTREANAPMGAAALHSISAVPAPDRPGADATMDVEALLAMSAVPAPDRPDAEGTMDVAALLAGDALPFSIKPVAPAAAAVPILRTFVPIVAGAAQMTYTRFASYNVIGGAAWVASMTCIGYFLGSMFERMFGVKIEHHIEKVIIVVVFVSILPGIIAFLQARRERAASSPST